MIRLPSSKKKGEKGFLSSIECLKELLTLARDVLEVEKEVDTVSEILADFFARNRRSSKMRYSRNKGGCG